MEDIIKKIASNNKFISHPIKCNLTNNRVNIVQIVCNKHISASNCQLAAITYNP